MGGKNRARFLISLTAIILVTMACGLPFAGPQAAKPTGTATSTVLPTVSFPAGTGTPAAGLPAGGSSVGGTGGYSGVGSAGAGGGSGGSGNGGTGGNNGSGNSAPPTQLPDISAVLYTVKQIETLGGESISGIVCDLTKPFSVNAATSKVAWVFVFVPKNANSGSVQYSYSIPSAGEAHDATGSYTISPADTDGTRHLSLKGSDHVVFKGFDGNIPVFYKFDLVPSSGPGCAPNP